MITTTARRIQRTAATHGTDYRLTFDANGHLVDAVVGPEPFPANLPAGGYRLRGGRQTQRQVQDALDGQDEARRYQTV